MATPIEQLNLMRNLRENWDGYGGAPPSPLALAAAIAFYSPLTNDPGLPEPQLTPSPTGGVQFDWDAGPHHLEIAFEPRPDGAIQVEFLYDNADTGERVSGTADRLRDHNRLPYPVRQLVTGFAAAAA